MPKRFIDASQLPVHTGYVDEAGKYVRVIYAADVEAATAIVTCGECIFAQERYGHLECLHGVCYRNTWNAPDFFCPHGVRKYIPPAVQA